MITGYLNVGMLLSPSVTPWLSAQILADTTEIVSSLALGAIAYIIGGSLRLRNLAGLEKASS